MILRENAAFSRLVTSFFSRCHFCAYWLCQVVDHMLDLWAAGERDMLDERNQYQLTNTGQGLQRVQVIFGGMPR